MPDETTSPTVGAKGKPGEPGRPGGQGGAGGAGGEGQEVGGQGGTGGAGGQGGAEASGLSRKDDTGEKFIPPAWWSAWWSGFQADQWRNITRIVTATRRVTMAALVAAVLSLLVSMIGWVQADVRRDSQGEFQETLDRANVTLDRIDVALAALGTQQNAVAEDTALVADYIAEVQARPPALDSGAVLRSLARIEQIAQALGLQPVDQPPGG